VNRSLGDNGVSPFLYRRLATAEQTSEEKDSRVRLTSDRAEPEHKTDHDATDVGVAMIKRQNVMVKSLVRIVCKQTRFANIPCGIEKSL
jgi:hypothetical protein